MLSPKLQFLVDIANNASFYMSKIELASLPPLPHNLLSHLSFFSSNLSQWTFSLSLSLFLYPLVVHLYTQYL